MQIKMFVEDTKIDYENITDFNQYPDFSIYLDRAKFFYNRVLNHNVFNIIEFLYSMDFSWLEWVPEKLDISSVAFNRIRSQNIQFHKVFAHPVIVSNYPKTIMYYRYLASIPRKAVYRFGFVVDKYERLKGKSSISISESLNLCRLFNRFVSALVESVDNFSLETCTLIITSSIGTMTQGSWVNSIGTTAANGLNKVICDYVEQRSLGTIHDNKCVLNNGWVIVFGSEPDVSIVDGFGVLRIAIEIKGSLDLNGAQSRYGEAKKTFDKQRYINPECYMIYLASCFTDSLLCGLERDGDVDVWFNLGLILTDSEERDDFLNKLFDAIEDLNVKTINN